MPHGERPEWESGTLKAQGKRMSAWPQWSQQKVFLYGVLEPRSSEPRWTKRNDSHERNEPCNADYTRLLQVEGRVASEHVQMLLELAVTQ